MNILYQDTENGVCPTYKTRKMYPVVGDYGSPSLAASFSNSETRKVFFCALYTWQFGSILNNLYQTNELRSHKPEFFTSTHLDISKKE